jgi:hypothetical protein
MPKDWEQPGENPDPEKTTKIQEVPIPLNENFPREKLKKVS